MIFAGRVFRISAAAAATAAVLGTVALAPRAHAVALGSGALVDDLARWDAGPPNYDAKTRGPGYAWDGTRAARRWAEDRLGECAVWGGLGGVCGALALVASAPKSGAGVGFVPIMAVAALGALGASAATSLGLADATPAEIDRGKIAAAAAAVTATSFVAVGGGAALAAAALVAAVAA